MDDLTYGEMPAVIREHWREFPALMPWEFLGGDQWCDWIKDKGVLLPQSVVHDPEWESMEDAGVVVILSDN